MARHINGNLIEKKSLLVLLKLVSFPGIVHRSLALLIGVLLLSESVAATTKQFSPLLNRSFSEEGWGGASSLAQQPAATEQDATLAAAERLMNEGFQLIQQGTAESKRQAIGKWEEAVTLYRAVSNQANEADALLTIGTAYDNLGEKQKALEFYNQALPIFQALENTQREALTLSRIETLYDIYNSLEDRQKALEVYNRELSRWRAVGNPKGEATILFQLGLLHLIMLNRQQSLDYFNQSLTLWRRLGDSGKEAETLLYIGTTYAALGERHKALELFNQQALPLARTAGEPSIEAPILIAIAGNYRLLGEVQKALDSLNQVLSLWRTAGDKVNEALILQQIGVVYMDLGENQKALDFFNQALPVIRTARLPLVQASTLQHIGIIHAELGDEQKALEFYNQALAIERATGNLGGQALTLNSISSVHLSLGNIKEALDALNQALPLIEKFSPATKAPILKNLGSVYFSLGETQKALEFYNRALTLIRVEGRPELEVQTLADIALLERNRGNLNEALTQMKAAIEIIEKLRTNVASKELRASYFASKQDYYQFYIDLLMQLHKTNPSKGYDALALNASERARARNLLEILTEARADIRRGADPNLAQQERTLQQQLNAQEYRKYQLLKGQYTNKELDDIQNNIKSLLSQLNEVQAQIRVKSPSYAALTQPGAFTLNLQQIQQQVLDDNTLLLEYSLGEDRSYLWAVTKTGITSYELPKGADIEAAAKEFYKQLQSEAVTNPEAGMKLSQMLLAPVASQLGQKRLVIVSDGVLQSIPFAALPIPDGTSPPAPLLQGEGSNSPPFPRREGGGMGSPLGMGGMGGLGFTPLLVQHEIVSLPSASTIALLRREVKDRPPAAKTLAVLANPVFSRDDHRFKIAQQPRQNTIPPTTDPTRSSPFAEPTETYVPLPNTLTEAQQILQFVPNPTQSLQAIGFAASRATATSPELAQYRMIHFATHGSANEEHPELSKVVLSLVDEKGADINGFLHLQDIFNLNLPAELVVLSACQTGLGKDVKGEGLVGLTRGFMYAGSKRVVVSLWRVKDRSTAELMTNFYQQMLQQGLNPVAALRAAQLKMLQSEQWKSPYYWAPFVIQGEWR